MKILLIHPEGNLNYNVNHLGLIETLGGAGHHVTYVAPRLPKVNQEPASPFVTVKLIDDRYADGPLLFPQAKSTDNPDTTPDFESWGGYDLVLGVDRGIIEGARVARHYEIPHALISYEIFFLEETSAEFKALEIEACRELAFAICQDELRARKLCLENNIPPDKVLRIPVAGRGFHPPPNPKPRLLHEMFQLPEHVRTVLHIGSFADWTHAQFLLKSTHDWPDDWVLVVHSRYGLAPGNLELIRELGHPDRVRASEAMFAHPGEMSAFIQSADMGIALYRPTYISRWVGRNIEYIGLSSSKIACFLQHGIPVATHDLGEISDWIRFYGAGQVFALDRPFVPQTPSASSSQACHKLFDRHLDLERFKESLLEAVANVDFGCHVVMS